MNTEETGKIVVTKKTTLGVLILVAALILGLLGDGLLRAVPWGLNLGLWLVGMVVAIALLARWGDVMLVGSGRWLLLPAIAFAFAFAWRDSAVLGLANFAAILGCVGLAVAYSKRGGIAVAQIAEYLLAGLQLSIMVPAGVFITIGNDVEWNSIARGGWTRRAAPIGTGLVLAIPLLLIFGALFASADAVFSTLAANLFHWNLTDTIIHLLLVCFWGCVAGGIVREALLHDPKISAFVERRMGFSLGTVEVATVLGLLDALFLAFVAVQIRYLFGGAALVDASVQLTYAEYARRGFFELVAVVALALPVLLLADWLLRRERPADERLFRGLAGLLVVMLFVVMASALQRMSLYEEQFGLTELRLYTTAFMLWLAILLLWLVATVLLGRRHRFAFGAVMTGLILVAVLDLLNPDSFIASTNVVRAQSGARFDSTYLTGLSADAVPEIVRDLPGLPEQDRTAIAGQLLKRWSRPPTDDLRQWNWARITAWEAVTASGDRLQQPAETGR